MEGRATQGENHPAYGTEDRPPGQAQGRPSKPRWTRSSHNNGEQHGLEGPSEGPECQ